MSIWLVVRVRDEDLRKVVPPAGDPARHLLSFFMGPRSVCSAPTAGKSSLLRIRPAPTRIHGRGFAADVCASATAARAAARSEEGRPRQRGGRRGLDARAADALRGGLHSSASRSTATRWRSCATMQSSARPDRCEQRVGPRSARGAAMDALRVPPATPTSRRSRAGSGAAFPLPAAAAVPTRHAAARRATNHLDAESVALAGALLDEYPGTVVAITHDRYFLDNVAKGSSSSIAARHPVGRQLVVADAEGAAAGAGGEGGRGPAAHAVPRARVGADVAARAEARARRGPAYDALLQEASEKRADALEISIPGPAPRRRGGRGDHLVKGYGDRVLIDDLSFKLPRGGIVGVIGPNGAGRRPCSA